MVDITHFKQAEEAVHERERWFRALIENSFDIITVIDAEGIVRYTTPSGERLTGYTASLGKSAFDFVHPEDVERIAEVFGEAMSRPGVTGQVRLRVRHAKGHWLVFETIAHNLLENPDVNGLV